MHQNLQNPPPLALHAQITFSNSRQAHMPTGPETNLRCGEARGSAGHLQGRVVPRAQQLQVGLQQHRGAGGRTRGQVQLLDQPERADLQADQRHGLRHRALLGPEQRRTAEERLHISHNRCWFVRFLIV